MNNSRYQEEIDSLIGRFFSAFDNRDVAPRLADICECFSDKAVVARHAKEGAETFTVIEFAQPRIRLLTDGTLLDFSELEISASTRVIGGIATRISRYSKSGVLNGSRYAGSGTKCFQLIALACGWRISALAWTDDDA